MMHALITGTLHGDPERKFAKTGKPYISAKVRVGSGENATWWRVLCFGSAGDELLELHDSDAISLSGRFEAQARAVHGGNPRLDLTIFADKLISAKPKKRERSAGGRINPLDAQRPLDARDRDLDDALPDGWQ